MSITAVVPVWNGRDLLARLLASLAAQTTPAAEVLVVDNGSQDDAPELAFRLGARVIPMGRNAGFAAAVNRGIREARGEWIAVLNSDVELAPDYFEKLLAVRAPFATGKILQAAQPQPGQAVIDATFDALCRGATAWRVGSGRADGPIFSQELAIASPPWTAVLIRADVFPRVGFLEETFESYLEDVDFGMRCAALHIQGRYVPTALARHRGSATLGRWHPETVRRIARNQLLLLARHYSSRLILRWLWPILVAQLLWGAVALRHGTGFAWLRGKWQGLSAFADARGNGRRLDAEFLKKWLPENERRIHEIQQATGFDSYWRLYFFLTRGGTK
ncbi:MAG TPA: glycosyltransferase family 2 protein [Candidatus Acidoferrales bacterium]|nr:glycosyltransferase family 2 protein [Candidatus Acidoferrales bacterium]